MDTTWLPQPSCSCKAAAPMRAPAAARHTIPCAVETAVALLAAGQRAEAIAHLNPLRPAAAGAALQCNLVGLTYLSADAPRKALAWFDRALALQKGAVDVIVNRASALDAMGETGKALDGFAEAFRRGCDDPVAHDHQARLLLRAGRLDEAIQACDRALKLRPAYPQALRTAATILRRLGRDAAALAFVQEAARLEPGEIGIQLDRINLLQHLGRLEEALAACDEVLARSPGAAAVLNNRGVILHDLGRLTEAGESCAAALRFDPRLASAHLNLGNVLLHQCRPEAALAPLEAALRLRPDYPEAASSRGLALKSVGRFDEAAATLDAVLARHPDFAHARKNRGELRLLHGDFKRGLPDYEARLATGDQVRPHLQRAVPQWTLAQARGSRVAVFADQGNGDIVQFARYLPLMADAGADVTFVCPPKLQRILRQTTRRVAVSAALVNEDGFTHQVVLSSLPFAFGTTLETIPAPTAYIAAEPDVTTLWRDRLGSEGFKVGLCWRGNMAWQADPSRSIPLESLSPLTALPGVRAISLQVPSADAVVGSTPAWGRVEGLGAGFDSGPDAFVDTAAVMQSLDLVVTCDTSIAHLAGALGRPVWVLLKAIPEWRWLLDVDTSPWYPTMRLFRQARGQGWDEPVARLGQKLAERAACGGEG